MCVESVMPSNHFILCQPLLLPPSIFPSIRVFSNDSVLHIRWLKYWSFSFSISLSNEYSGLISFTIDWLDLLAVRDSQESSPTPQFKSINTLVLNFLYGPTLTSRQIPHRYLLWSLKMFKIHVQMKMANHTRQFGAPLAVQWLGLCTLTAGSKGSVPGQRTKILKPLVMAKTIKKNIQAYDSSLPALVA